MSDHVGAITPNVLITLANSGADVTRYLKQMFILYEKIFYFPQSGDTEGAHRILSGFSGRDKAEREELRASRAFGAAIVESEDIWTREEHWRVMTSTMLLKTDAAAAEAASDGLGDQLQKLMFGFKDGREDRIAQFQKWWIASFFLMNDVVYAELVRRKYKFGGSLLLGDHKTVVEVCSNLGVAKQTFPSHFGNATKILAPSILDNLRMPDFGSLPWGLILELRRDRFVRDFRAKIGKLMRFTTSPRGADIDLNALVDTEIWRMAEDVQPSTLWSRVGKAVVSVTHVPPFEWISPAIHLTADLREMLESSVQRDTYGWLYFVANARKKALGWT